MRTIKTCSLLLVAILSVPAGNLSPQQSSDPEFNTTVAHPAYTKNYPRVVFDEAHNNFHTTTGRYKPFVDLISSDGYNVVPGRKLFAKPSLSTFKILVIANALGAEDIDDEGADRSAFTEEECDVVRDWVKSGGSLLLIADHAPFGAAAESLGKRFGVEMSKGYTFDPENDFKASGTTTLLFSRENKRLLEHPITQGRNAGERINQVLTFTGQSLKGPEASSVLLLLSQTARDKPDRESQTSVSAAGRAQGIAFKFGKGRVVVLGEAAMMSAQVAGPEKRPMGMNVPGNDNRQLALNIMHWLSGLL
jgi:hypothetical protein